MPTVKPIINVLTPGQIESVHNYALTILTKTGIRVDWEKAREWFTANGCRVQSDGRVLFTEKAITDALTSAPEAVTFYNRSGEVQFTLGTQKNSQTRFGIGVTNLYYQDPLTDAVSPFALEHVGRSVRLANSLGNFDLISTPGIAQDQNPHIADLKVTADMVANTIKPLVLLVSEHEVFDPVLKLVTHLHPQNDSKPFAIPYVNPITPLVLNRETLEKMVSAIRRGLPIIYNNYGMSGATAPITAAGTLAVLTAELLAGLTFSQIVQPGTPMIMGSLPAGFDMHAMIGTYTPQTVLLNLACAEMMAYYGLPHSGTSGSGPGWGADLLAGGALWLNHLTACAGKVGLVPFVAGNHDSMAFSPPAAVYADEVIHQARQFSKGFDLSDKTVALDQIDKIGPGGNFLESDQTFNLFRAMTPHNTIWPVMSLEKWQQASNPKAETILREKTVALLQTAPRPEDHDRIRSKSDAFIAAYAQSLK